MRLQQSTEVDVSIEGPGAIVFVEAKHNCDFYFILLDIAPFEALRSLKPRVSLDRATRPDPTGFSGKWATAYWSTRYKYGSRGNRAPLQKLLAGMGFPEAEVQRCGNEDGLVDLGGCLQSRTPISCFGSRACSHAADKMKSLGIRVLWEPAPAYVSERPGPEIRRKAKLS